MTGHGNRKDLQDFRFESTLLATLLPKCMGLMLIWISIDGLKVWLHPSRDRLPYMLLLIPIHALLWAAGGALLYGICYIQIVEGQFRFRRFFVWTSVPLESITGMRLLRVVGIISLKVDYGGKRHWLIFYPDNLQLQVQLRRSPPPVIQFLEEVYKRNVANSGAHAHD